MLPKLVAVGLDCKDMRLGNKGTWYGFIGQGVCQFIPILVRIVTHHYKLVHYHVLMNTPVSIDLSLVVVDETYKC